MTPADLAVIEDNQAVVHGLRLRALDYHRMHPRRADLMRQADELAVIDTLSEDEVDVLLTIQQVGTEARVRAYLRRFVARLG
jgi:hypothetical protein